MPGCRRILSQLFNISLKMQDIINHSVVERSLNLNKTYIVALNDTTLTHKMTADLNDLMLVCGEVSGDKTQGFLVSNDRLLIAIILGVVLILLILSTLRFVLKVFSRYSDDHEVIE